MYLASSKQSYLYMEVAAGEIEAWGFPSLVQFDQGIR
jgi:hypothetical protein